MAQILSIFLLSTALIGSQIAYMQALAQAQWSHFAYMIIAVAMLGFGASGTWLAIMRKPLLRLAGSVIPLLMIGAAISMGLALYLVQSGIVRFDMIELFMGGSGKRRLALTYLVFFVPFVLGALAIGISFAGNPDKAATLYAANLTGSALGGPVALLLLWLMPAPQTATVFALLTCGAAITAARHTATRIAAILAAALCIASLIQPVSISPSSYKDLARALQLPQTKVAPPSPHPMGSVTTVSSPAMRYAPGLSLTFTGNVPIAIGIFVNGDGYGSLLPEPQQNQRPILDFTTRALPYALAQPDSILILGAAAGTDADHALHRLENGGSVTAVESHPVVGAIAAAHLGEKFGGGRLEWITADPRAYLSRVHPHRSDGRFDLIILPTVGEFGGNSGLRGIQEDFLLTRQAVAAALETLAADGLLAVTVWIDYPPRQSLRLGVLLVEALRDVGIDAAANHMLIVRSWGTATFVISKSAFSERQLQRAKDFCAAMGFDLLQVGKTAATGPAMHSSDDDLLVDGLEEILSGRTHQLIAAFPFDLRPPTDNRPFFNQFLRLAEWREYQRLFLSGDAPFFEIGLPLTLLTFVQIAAISLPLILIPLLLQRRSVGSGFSRPALYFTAVGCGFMLWEIILIQKLTLYWGNPIYAAAGVISTLLLGMGLGSWYTACLKKPRQRAAVICALIAATLTIYLILLGPAVSATIGWPMGIKVAVGILALLPPAVMMGMPFPLGLRWIQEPSGIRIAWAWGLDGYASVVSATATALLAALFGFTLPVVLAIAAYTIAAGAAVGRGRL